MTRMNSGGPQTRLIDGRFELLQRLGGGGMGVVWRARDNALHREVALKEVRPPDPAMAAADPAGAREMRERVLREARALARLQHPNVAVIHHIVDTAEHTHPWLVMELVRGGSLADRLAHGPLPVPEAARIGRGVLSALRAADAAGIQHRDVKPGNVLLRTDGTPVLTDFGIAAMHGATALTSTGALIGSPEYIAPERIRGGQGDLSADLWSLGMTLYVAIEGHHPLGRASTLATLAAVLDEPLPPPARAGQLGPLLGALLSKDPSLRPNAVQLDQALAAAEYAQATVAQDAVPPAWTPSSADTPPPSAPSDRVPTGNHRAKPGPPPRRRRSAAVVLSTVAAALAGVLLWQLTPGSTSSHAGGSATPGSSVGPLQPLGAASASASAAASAPSTDLLTPAGVRATIASMHRYLTGGKIAELVVYPGYATAEAPTAADPKLYDDLTYRDGTISREAGGSVTDGTVSLSSYNWDVLPALLRKAQATLKVPHPTSRYIIVGPDLFDGTPTIRVYLSDDYGGSGYLSATTQGVVKSTHPRE